MPTEAMELRDVGQLAHRPVGFGGIETDLALETDRPPDQVGQLGDGQLLARTNIDVAVPDILIARLERIFKIHTFHDEDRGVGHLLAPEELAQRPSRAPKLHPVGVDPVFI